MSEIGNKLCIHFVEMLGEPGTYDATVYDHFPDKDLEGIWFQKRYAYLDHVEFKIRSLPRGEELPEAGSSDGYILGGSYNSVHDDYSWQRDVLSWLPGVREQGVPLLGICGAHQLLSTYYGENVIPVVDGVCVGTLPVALTAAGIESELMKSVSPPARFHFANQEHVVAVPEQATLLAYTDRIGVAALSYGEHWYSTQFHPEASAESMGSSWMNSNPDYRYAYDDDDAGDQVIENFIEIVHRQTFGRR